jgi:plasmid stability protein
MPAFLCYHDVMAKQLTIRGVSDEVGRRLERVSRAKGQSVNATVLEILATAVGADERRRRLARYVTWSQEDLAEFNEALAAQRSTDDPLWR